MFNMKNITYTNLTRCLNSLKLYSTENVEKIVIPNRIHRGMCMWL